MRLKDRYQTAVVTGASSGLGAAFTEMLLAEGVSVWGTSRSPAALSVRDGFHAVGLELSDPLSVDQAWAAIEEASGGIDLLVNNAGGGDFGTFSSGGAEAWEHQIGVLLFGPVRLARRAFRGMAARQAGCIVNVTSMAVEFPIPFMSAYNAGKAGLSGFTDSFGLEAAGSGVLIIDFRPGDFQTGFNQAMHFHQPNGKADLQVAATWRRIEELMKAAPGAGVAARDLRRALVRGRCGIVRSGSFFQARLAAVMNRLVPGAASRSVRRRYFRLG